LAGDLWATFSGADPRAVFVNKPGTFRVEQVPATEARWPIGFSGLEKPQRFPFGLMLINGTYWIAFCINAGALGKNGLLKSTSGRVDGPYELAFPENRGVDQRIDSSLFQDTDGSTYYVWQDGMIRKLNEAMNGFDGEAQKIVPTDGQRVGYEGATLVKVGSWYVLTAAEWNGGGNRSDGAYDMT